MVLPSVKHGIVWNSVLLNDKASVIGADLVVILNSLCLAILLLKII